MAVHRFKTRIGLALIGLALCVLPASAERLRVAVAQPGFWNSSFIDFAQQEGFFAREGLEIEPFYTEGGASTLTPLIAGSVDVAMSNGFLGVIGAYVKGAPIRVISAESAGAADSFWYARAERGIQGLNDLRGKSVAFSSTGSSTNLTLLALLRQAGVDAKMIATGGVPATMTQVMSGQVDAGWSVPPFALKEIREKRLVIIARGSDVAWLRDMTIRVNLTSVNALKEKRDALTRYLRALADAIDWAYSGSRPLETYSRIAQVPLETAAQTRDEFFPKDSLRLGQIRGLDLALRQALEMKFISAPTKEAEITRLFDILAPLDR